MVLSAMAVKYEWSFDVQSVQASQSFTQKEAGLQGVEQLNT